LRPQHPRQSRVHREFLARETILSHPLREWRAREFLVPETILSRRLREWAAPRLVDLATTQCLAVLLSVKGVPARRSNNAPEAPVVPVAAQVLPELLQDPVVAPAGRAPVLVDARVLEVAGEVPVAARLERLVAVGEKIGLASPRGRRGKSLKCARPLV